MNDEMVKKIYETSMLLQKKYKNSKSHKSIRVYEGEDEGLEKIMGFTGEVIFAEKYNLEADLNVYDTGDGHIDFKVKINDDRILTIDVKTIKETHNFLLVKEWEMKEYCSDILVMGRFIHKKRVDFVGWTSRVLMLENEPKVFCKKTNIPNYYRHYTKLFSMEDLDKILKGPGIRMRQLKHRP
jgi:hypothetical protein